MRQLVCKILLMYLGGKFDKLYNSVSYNVDDMNIFINDIISAVSNKCECSNCIHGNQSVTFKNCHDAIKKLKQTKSDGCTGILSIHIIHASDKLTVYLALLFTAMLHHGTSPDGMLLATIVPLPKGRWANLSSSDIFRAITLSSIFGKLLDFIIPIKEENSLCTSDLQFSFKTGSSTSLCTTWCRKR